MARCNKSFVFQHIVDNSKIQLKNFVLRMTSTSQYDTNWTGTLESMAKDPALICRRVQPQRVVSLCFTFIAASFLLYLIAALCIYSFKKKLMIGCRGKNFN